MLGYTYVVTTDVSAEDLWAVAADFPNWPARQPGVESAQVMAGGSRLSVRESGCRGRTTISEFRSPSRLVVTFPLFLASMRTTYEFSPTACGTELRVTVDLLGPLGGLYALTHGSWIKCRVPVLVIGLIHQARHARPPRATPLATPVAAVNRIDEYLTTESQPKGVWCD